jgi:hypothetical protein
MTQLDQIMSALAALQAQVAELQAQDTGAQAQTQAPAGARPRDEKGRFLPTGKDTRVETTPDQAPAPEGEDRLTPADLLVALAGAKVGESVVPAGLSKRDVNKAVSGAGGTWQSSAWSEGANDTYTYGGKTYRFDNVKVYRQEATGRTRSITRLA